MNAYFPFAYIIVENDAVKSELPAITEIYY